MTDIIYDDSCLNLPPRLTFDEWIGHGKTLATMTDSIPWWVGDWINFGEARFGEGKYSQGLTLWDYNYNTLANMAWVASRYPPETRTGLSWTHHRYAATARQGGPALVVYAFGRFVHPLGSGGAHPAQAHLSETLGPRARPLPQSAEPPR